MGKLPPPTIKLISESTGYSVSSVSRVLNGLGNKYRISSKAQKQILDKALELNFKPNQIARGLRLKRTDTIGLIIPNISNPFFSEIAKIITRKARQVNLSILLLDSEDNELIQNEGLQLLVARKTDGIILFPVSSSCVEVEALYASGTPLVLIDRYFYDSTIPYVSSNNFQGAYQAVNYLLSMGHRRIVCLQGSPDASPNKERVKGYIQALKEIGEHDSSAIILGNAFSENSGYENTKKILKENRPTALFALSNLIALGAIKAIREAGLKIPDDISLITFDDQELLSMLTPAITAIDQPKNDIGERALDLLLKQIQQEPMGQSQIQLPTFLKIRESVKLIN